MLYRRKERTWKNRRRKRMMISILSVLFIAGIFAGFLFRIRGSQILAVREETGTDEIVFYHQRDRRWADDVLGDSSYTMEKSGCLVTCIAAALQMEGICDASMTPGKLNQYFSENQVYEADGNLQWTALEKLDGLHIEVPQALEPERITEHLRRKVYPIVRVRMHGLGNFHYVLIVKAEKGMYYCMDPLNEDQIAVPLSEFGNRGYAVRYVY